MKKGLKWFLGIVVGVVVVTALALAGFLVFNRWHGTGWMMNDRYSRIADNGRMHAWRDAPGQDTPWSYQSKNDKLSRSVWRLPISRFGIIRPLQMLFCCLIALGFLVLIALGIVYLAGGLRRSKQSAISLESAAPPTVTPLPTAPPVVSPTQTSAHACPHCAQLVQEGWRHCPYCGGQLSEQTENPPSAS
jgi:hypothetical protein